GLLLGALALLGWLSYRGAGRLPWRFAVWGGLGGGIGFTDDVAVASDGRIYFSDASSRWGAKQYLFDLLEARPWGRLLRYDPATRTTETLLENLYFANGVALSKDEDFVLVNETYRYRITRYWLAGEKRGTSEVFADNLPGFPDGIAADGRGGFWVAMFAPRNPQADLLHRHPFAKSLLARLPGAFWPKPQRYGLAVQLDANGRVLRTLQDPTGQRVPQVTSAWEHAGWLYLGNLTEPYASRIRL
ncbi:MAG TPA: SMP-30/gluconolactonase/LRE family protein, partial [Thermoanaerobaculia bacterium]|nr:SMP-30/gluconolactonase/LRE family protein [Thermoanaerobaculia bacterium]